MTYKLCVFDIDGVLNKTGKPVQTESMEALEKLEEHGLKISFASGKHPWYITGGLIFSGLLRKDTVVIGESGGYVFFPKEMERVLYTEHLADVKKLKNIFYDEMGSSYEFWEEPKETLFTLFLKNTKEILVLADKFEKIIQDEDLNLYVIRQVDAIDVMQTGLSKKVGLTVLCDRLGISLEGMIGFGDGLNDLEMLSCVGYPVAVENAVDEIKSVVKERGGYISKVKYGEGVLEAVNYLIENNLI
ncbi:MAG: HAD family hydrolase [Candidatus Methanofastidiosia archaeon]